MHCSRLTAQSATRAVGSACARARAGSVAKTRPLGSLQLQLPRPVLKSYKHMTAFKLFKDNRLSCDFLSLCADCCEVAGFHL